MSRFSCLYFYFFFFFKQKTAYEMRISDWSSDVCSSDLEQKERMLVPLIKGEDRACFGVTEPDAGLDTTSISTFATKVDGGYRVTGRKIWTSSGQVANKILLLTRTTPKEQCRKPTDGKIGRAHV